MEICYIHTCYVVHFRFVRVQMAGMLSSICILLFVIVSTSFVINGDKLNDSGVGEEVVLLNEKLNLKDDQLDSDLLTKKDVEDSKQVKRQYATCADIGGYCKRC